MTTTTSKIGVAIDTLIALFGPALPALTVYDGSTTTMSFKGDWLVVGGDGAVNAEETGATSHQVWKGLGARTRDEMVTVTCAVGASSGTADARGFKPVRDRALANLAAVETVLRADPSLGSITQGAAEISDADLHYSKDSQGLEASLVFTITVPFRLER